MSISNLSTFSSNHEASNDPSSKASLLSPTEWTCNKPKGGNAQKLKGDAKAPAFSLDALVLNTPAMMAVLCMLPWYNKESVDNDFFMLLFYVLLPCYPM